MSTKDFKVNDPVMLDDGRYRQIKVVTPRDPDNHDNFIGRVYDNQNRCFNEATESIPYKGVIPYKRRPMKDPYGFH